MNKPFFMKGAVHGVDVGFESGFAVEFVLVVESVVVWLDSDCDVTVVFGLCETVVVFVCSVVLVTAGL